MDETRNPDPDGQPDFWLVDRLLDPKWTGPGPSQAPDDDGAISDVDRERVRMAAVVDALRQPGTAAELADEASYLRAFDEATTAARKPTRTIVIGTRAAVAAGVLVLAAATGAAAYTGSLPGPLQRAAHSAIGAPAADQGSDDGTDQAGDDPTGSPTDTPTGSPSETATETPTGGTTSHSPVGPDATGAAAFGLCTAWSKGGLATTSVAYRNLSTAAGGPDGITAYCASIVKPGSGSTHGGGSPTSHPHGSPTSHPHGSPTSHPDKTSHPTGSPTSHPGH